MKQAIFFFHWGPSSIHLVKALASAQVFNPEIPIFLITNDRHQWSSSGNIRILETAELHSDKLKKLEQAYQHISANPEFFERLCFYRWFYLDKAMERYQVDKAILLDNDCLLTASISDLAQQAYLTDITVCRSGFPHCTFVHKTTAKLLDYFINTFENVTLIQDLKKAFSTGQTFGLYQLPLVVSDMYLIWRCLEEEKGVYSYNYSNDANTILDQCMSWGEGFEIWGRFPMKRIKWKFEDARYVPYFCKEGCNSLVRAHALHYKGAAKRYMPNINTFPQQNSLFRFLKKIRNNTLPHSKWI
jgi:hypothetical protein